MVAVTLFFLLKKYHYKLKYIWVKDKLNIVSMGIIWSGISRNVSNHTHTQKWLYGTGISNDKFWNPKCNFFAFSFVFVVVKTSALSPHSYVCWISDMHSCSCAFSRMCFHYYDLFNVYGERKVSGMFLYMYLNYMTPSVCMWVYVRLCVTTESRDHTCNCII